MSIVLNHTQPEILKLLQFLKEDKDLEEIKSLSASYLSDKVVRNADQAFDEKQYTADVFKKWKQEHFRKLT